MKVKTKKASILIDSSNILFHWDFTINKDFFRLYMASCLLHIEPEKIFKIKKVDRFNLQQDYDVFKVSYILDRESSIIDNKERNYVVGDSITKQILSSLSAPLELGDAKKLKNFISEMYKNKFKFHPDDNEFFRIEVIDLKTKGIVNTEDETIKVNKESKDAL